MRRQAHLNTHTPLTYTHHTLNLPAPGVHTPRIRARTHACLPLPRTHTGDHGHLRTHACTAPPARHNPQRLTWAATSLPAAHRTRATADTRCPEAQRPAPPLTCAPLPRPAAASRPALSCAAACTASPRSSPTGHGPAPPAVPLAGAPGGAFRSRRARFEGGAMGSSVRTSAAAATGDGDAGVRADEVVALPSPGPGC